MFEVFGNEQNRTLFIAKPKKDGAARTDTPRHSKSEFVPKSSYLFQAPPQDFFQGAFGEHCGNLLTQLFPRAVLLLPNLR
jgi:hypothetical protein